MKTRWKLLPLIVGCMASIYIMMADEGSHPEESFSLFTEEEALELQLPDTFVVERLRSYKGPHIRIIHPDLDTTEMVLRTITPTDIKVHFQKNSAPVSMQSLNIHARKGIFKVSLTDRLQPYIHGDSLIAIGIDIPTGKFCLQISIADENGQKTKADYLLYVEKENE